MNAEHRSNRGVNNVLLLCGSAALRFILIKYLLFSTTLAQEKIYKWTDKQGKVHFSNSQTMLEQKEAELPVIQKENIESKINRLKQNTPASCENHGGLDCASGKDFSDGSVICIDSFRDSIQPFDFYCTEAKLSENTKVSEINEIATIEVSLRNESAIKARNIKVKYKLEEFRKIEVELTGPNDIEPFGLETYSFISKDKLDKRYPDRAIMGRSIVSCDNCAPIKRLTKRSK